MDVFRLEIHVCSQDRKCYRAPEAVPFRTKMASHSVIDRDLCAREQGSKGRRRNLKPDTSTGKSLLQISLDEPLDIAHLGESFVALFAVIALNDIQMCPQVIE